MSILLLCGASLFCGAGAFAQKPSFEVASIKPAAPQEMGRMAIRLGGDPGRVDYKSAPLRMLIAQAFNVKDYQIVGPDWMGGAMFDVEAKLPPDTTPENRRLMMQSLLEQRFGLQFHKDTKELPIYSLVVAKNGPKLEKAEDTDPGPNADGPSGGSGGGRIGGPGGPPPDTKQMAAAIRSGRPGNMMMRMGEGGKTTLVAKTPVAGLADMLARQLGRPVFDNTGLKGNYNIQFEFKPDVAAMRGMPGPMPRPEGAGDGSGAAASDPSDAASIFTALQEQLGLKLESKKGSVETIVIDHIEKTPTEN